MQEHSVQNIPNFRADCERQEWKESKYLCPSRHFAPHLLYKNGTSYTLLHNFFSQAYHEHVTEEAHKHHFTYRVVFIEYTIMFTHLEFLIFYYCTFKKHPF